MKNGERGIQTPVSQVYAVPAKVSGERQIGMEKLEKEGVPFPAFSLGALNQIE